MVGSLATLLQPCQGIRAMQCPPVVVAGWFLHVGTAQGVRQQGVQGRMALDRGNAAAQPGEHGAVAAEAAGGIKNPQSAAPMQPERPCQRLALAGDNAPVDGGRRKINHQALGARRIGPAQRQPAASLGQIKAMRRRPRQVRQEQGAGLLQRRARLAAVVQSVEQAVNVGLAPASAAKIFAGDSQLVARIDKIRRACNYPDGFAYYLK